MNTGQGTQRVDTGGGTFIQGNIHVQRDFIGRDLYKNYYVQQVTPVFTPRPVDTTEREQPYFSGQPFRVNDRDLFTGREREIDAILRQIRDPAALTAVAYGPADVGKTSFLSAGVLPNLSETGADVFPLRDYGDAASLLRALLLGRASEMKLDISASAPVPELAKAIIETSTRRLVLVLDQFERFFLQDVSKVERAALRDALEGIIQVVDPRLFQIIIAIRDDWQSALDRQWGDWLPSLRQSPVHLPPLDREQAKVAIMHPIQKLGIQPVFDEEFLDNQLLFDLDRLSLEQEGNILPADLQIICQYLYKTAKSKQAQSIKTKLYFEMTEGKGAEWILDRNFKALLDKVEGAQRKRAREIATEMLAQDPQTWTVPSQLPISDASPGEIETTLEEMARAGLLIWHLTGDQRAYAFSSNSIAKAAERALGREAQKRLQARRELEYVWRGWMMRDGEASKYQLNLLEEHYPKGPFPTERALVVLRSAVAKETQVQPWLERLDNETTREMLRELEAGDAEGSTQQTQAGRVLGLYDEKVPTQPQSTAFGSMAWTATAHPEWEVRETAALALMSAYGTKALERLETAVQAAAEKVIRRSGQRRRRLAALRGILADANQEMAKKIRETRWHERLGTWWWRFRRRFRRDIRYLGSLTLGGALGAGLGLGLLRAVLAPLLHQGSGLSFYGAFPVGFWLGGALALGLLLVNVMRLRSPEPESRTANERPFLQAVALGTFGFALMHLLHILLFNADSLVKKPLVAFLALVAGTGLSQATYDQPRAGWHIGAGRWLLRLVIVMLAFALVQAIFVQLDILMGPNSDMGAGLVFTWSGYFYRSRLGSTLNAWGLQGILDSEYWFHYAAIIDAALTGVTLTVGLTAGLTLTNKWYQKWSSLIRRSEGE
jgi:MFS family permease